MCQRFQITFVRLVWVNVLEVDKEGKTKKKKTNGNRDKPLNIQMSLESVVIKSTHLEKNKRGHH